MAQLRAPRPTYRSPVAGRSVERGIKTAGLEGRGLDTAMNRRMKLNEALGKFRGK